MLKLLMDWAQFGANMATIMGAAYLFVAFKSYRDAKAKEAEDREYGTYDSIGKRFEEFLQICFDNPSLEVYSAPSHSQYNPASLSKEEKIRREILVLKLFCLLEYAYLNMVKRKGGSTAEQWPGWIRYMDIIFRPDSSLREYWTELGRDLDKDFVNYVDSNYYRKAAE